MLAIPPAWENVWICATEDGHIQAVGRDARGRKQYRYHPRYREVRDQTKFERMAAFGAALPKIREQIDQDLSLPGLPKRKVVAAIVRLMDETCMRVGNEEYAKANHSFGLTTLRDRHAQVSGNTIRLHFLGKSKQEHDILLRDRRLSRIVKKCQDLPGQELFQYQDGEGDPVKVESADVNEYLREVTQEDFTAPGMAPVTWPGNSPPWGPLLPRPKPSETSWWRSRRRRNCWATVRLRAASITCIPPFSTPIWNGRSCRSAKRRARLRRENCGPRNWPYFGSSRPARIDRRNDAISLSKSWKP
jgi:hypothetical protein